jgi:nucleotide-binding universal stress UspA family protein
MGAMKDVLVPVDGSESALRAVRWVSSVLAGQPGARVHLLTVRPAVDAWEVRSHLGADDIRKFEADAAAAVLDPAVAIVSAAGVDVSPLALVSDDVPEAIAAHTRKHHCDAIVMGTRGLAALQTVLLGSTTLRVIHLVDVPVTVIK